MKIENEINIKLGVWINLVAIFVMLTLLTACSGGGGGGGDSTSSGSSGSLSSTGTVTGFGSVFVNGTRFNTSNAIIIRGEQQVLESDLNLGMQVSVQANSSNSASRVEFEEDVEGPVDVNDNSGTFSVMGQTVITNAQTVFDNGGLATLTPGTVAEVSGFRNANDDIVATFVENKGNGAALNDYEVIGIVRNLNTAAMTFQIDDLTVNYNAADVNDLINGVPMLDQLVEVKDANKAYVANSFMLSATKVELQAPFGGGANPGARVEIESVVTRVISPSMFEISNLTIVTNGNTQFLFGTADQIQVGTRLEVEGTIDSFGVLVASKVKFEDNDARIIGTVFAKGVNTVTMLANNGVVVTVTPQTDLEDNTSNNAFSFADIQVNDYLEIRGFIGTNSALIATELEREDPDQDARIRGPVSAFDAVAGTVTILGITLNTNAQTQFEGLNDQVIAASTFFNSLTAGLTIVQGQWDPFNNITDPVKELELED